jgi:hypothetical protein
MNVIGFDDEETLIVDPMDRGLYKCDNFDNRI